MRHLEAVGAIPIGILGMIEADRRPEAWGVAREVGRRARDVSFAGVVLIGLRFETVVGEAYEKWHESDERVTEQPRV